MFHVLHHEPFEMNEGARRDWCQATLELGLFVYRVGGHGVVLSDSPMTEAEAQKAYADDMEM